MGDLRNKVAKQMRDEAHRQFMARHYPPSPSPPPPRCQCGLTYTDTMIWAAPQRDHWDRERRFWCWVCIPDEYRHLVIQDVINMTEGT